ncbi:hypothetical protein H0Z60_02220 [Ectothiorhodospiraceae bacterium WFHF3C12]|nr:hypothetical protein [Ectothiorhodospiraceae bacterium WFHF3C12]
MITFMMALFAVFSFLRQRQPSPANLAISAMAIVFGLVINYVFATRIRSGLAYMDSHKSRLREYEAKLRLLNPLLGGIVDTADDRIAGQSATARLMRWIPLLSYVVWTVCSAILLLKLGGRV